jgi:transposase
MAAIIESQRETIGDLRELVTQLQKRISSLEEQLGLGGPPKSGGKRVPQIKANKPVQGEKSKRKKRDLHFCRKREIPTWIVEHKPSACPDCGRILKGGGPKTSRQVIDIKFTPVEVTEHILHSCYCGVCKKRVVANPDLSAEVSGNRRFGHNLTSLIAMLRTEARLPIRSIKTLLQRMHGLRISEGAITNLLNEVAAAGSSQMDEFRDQARSAQVLHADESSWRENGQNGYTWLLSTPNTRVFEYDRHRSYEVAQRIIGLFTGTLVTDFYYTYNQIASRHQRCWVHFLRDLHDLREGANEAENRWIDDVIALWQEGVDYQAYCLTKPLFGASLFERKRKRGDLEERIYELAEPYLDKDPKVCKPATLSKRIAMFLSELFTFVEYPEVPHHNNSAERAIRPVVIARKISGGTRSAKGTATRMTLMSLFSTWKLRGIDPIARCRQLLITSP